MSEPRLKALAVLGCSTRARTGGEAHDDRHRNLAAQHEAHLRGLVDDLLHGEGGEIRELELEDRPHSGDGCANGDACTAELGDRHVDHPLGAEALDEVARHLEGATIDADVLAHQEDARIAFQRDGHGFLDGLRIAEFTNGGVHHCCSV